MLYFSFANDGKLRVKRQLLWRRSGHAQSVIQPGGPCTTLFDAHSCHLTSHLGDDQYGQDPKFSDYEDFNIAQAQNVIATLARDPEKAKRLADFIAVHEIGAHERYRAALPKALSILDVE